MLPLADLHSQLDEALNINASQSVFSTLYYTDLINAQRELWIRNEYNKNRSIDPNLQQVLPCVELELVDPTICCVQLPNACKILRTKLPIPNTIEFNNSKGITSVGPVDITSNRFSFIDYARVPYIGSGRTTSKSIYAFLYERYIYIVSKDPFVWNMRWISIRGIFTDPTSLGQFFNCENKPCYSPNDVYPINLWMWEYIKGVIVPGLLQKQGIPLDDSNDDKDNKADDTGGIK